MSDLEEVLDGIRLESFFADKAQKELGETPERRKESVLNLSEMVRRDDCVKCYDSIPTAAQKVRFYLMVLRLSKFDMEKAFDRIVKMKEAMSRYSDDFWKLRMSHLLPVFSSNFAGLLPKRDDEGSRIMYVKSSWNPKVTSVDDMFLAEAMSIAKAMYEEESEISGLIIIFDHADLTWNHLMYFTPTFVYKCVTLAMRVFPVRIKAIHYVNEMSGFKMVSRLINKLAPRKVSGRIHFHGSDVESLHRFVHPDLLPADLDGNQPYFNNEHFVKELTEWEPEFLPIWEAGLPERNDN